jgi:hypothetical protein
VGASSIDHHECIFPREWRRIAPARVFIELRALGEGPRGHEAPHHVTVFELVPNGVHELSAGFLEEPLEVVHRRPRLTLIVVRGGRGAFHAGAVRLPIVAIITVSRGMVS